MRERGIRVSPTATGNVLRAGWKRRPNRSTSDDASPGPPGAPVRARLRRQSATRRQEGVILVGVGAVLRLRDRVESRRPWSFRTRVEHSKPDRKKVGKMPGWFIVLGPLNSISRANRNYDVSVLAIRNFVRRLVERLPFARALHTHQSYWDALRHEIVPNSPGTLKA